MKSNVSFTLMDEQGLKKVNPQSELPDLELWNLFKQGDRHAFQVIYLRYLEDLLNYGYHLMPERNMVKDCLHDLFLDLWVRRSHLGGVNHIKYYLFKALTRRIFEQKSKTKKNLHWEQSAEQIPGKIVLPFEQKLIEGQDHSINQRRLSQAIARLSDRQKQVIHLLFYEGFSYEEVSSIMNINLRSAYTLAWKAIKVLRRELRHFISYTLWWFWIDWVYALLPGY